MLHTLFAHIRPLRVWLGLALLLVGIGQLLPGSAQAQTSAGQVYVARIDGTIDLGLAPYLQRVIDEAEAAGAPLLILEINTPGGRLDAALQMREILLAAEVPTAAFVNREAFSAGALIALATETIYMAPGAVIGAATPVDGSGETADAKTISAVASTFRSTAEARGRDPDIAAAMVDPDLVVDGLVEEGALLTLTTDEARAAGFADGVISDRTELLAAEDLAGAAIQTTAPGLAENVVRFLTNPIVASLLTTFGILLILADLFSGGFGLLSVFGLSLFALFFWGHFIAGLAGWESVALVVGGLLLIAAEIFIVPGFGITGILGIGGIFGGLFLALVGGPITTTQEIAQAAYILSASLIGVIVGGVVLLRLLSRFGRMQGLFLQAQVGVAGSGTPVRRRRSWIEGSRMEAQTRTADTETPSLVGAVGTTLTDLHPAGIASINDERVDVVSEGEYIAADTTVEVIIDQRYRRVVRQLEKIRK
jgi:membrane-bound serine protease (ClpP class)